MFNKILLQFTNRNRVSEWVRNGLRFSKSKTIKIYNSKKKYTKPSQISIITLALVPQKFKKWHSTPTNYPIVTINTLISFSCQGWNSHNVCGTWNFLTKSPQNAPGSWISFAKIGLVSIYIFQTHLIDQTWSVYIYIYFRLT